MSDSRPVIRTIDEWCKEFFPRRRMAETVDQLRSDPDAYARYIITKLIREHAAQSGLPSRHGA